MSALSREPQWMVRYLLGRVSDEERRQLEDRYLADPDLFEELVAAEDDLIRSYVRGTLAPEERQAIEQRLQTDREWREQVAFQEAIAASLSERRSSLQAPDTNATSADGEAPARVQRARRSKRIWRVSRIAAMLLVVAGSGWLATNNRRLHRELVELKRDQAHTGRQQLEFRGRIAELEAELQRERSLANGRTAPNERMPPQNAATTSVTMALLMLTSRLARDAARREPFAVPADVSHAPVELRLDRDGHPSHAIMLETAEGAEVWQEERLRSRSHADGTRWILVTIPSEVLKEGTYILRVRAAVAGGGSEEMAAYALQIVRR